MDEQNKKIEDILEVVTFLRDNAATKKDLEGFATKEDLEGFATKTKEDFDKLDKRVVRIENTMVTKEELGEFKDEFGEFKDMVITNFDSLTKLVMDFQVESLAMRSRMERYELRMDNVVDYLKIEA